MYVRTHMHAMVLHGYMTGDYHAHRIMRTSDYRRLCLFVKSHGFQRKTTPRTPRVQSLGGEWFVVLSNCSGKSVVVNER